MLQKITKIQLSVLEQFNSMKIANKILKKFKPRTFISLPFSNQLIVNFEKIIEKEIEKEYLNDTIDTLSNETVKEESIEKLKSKVTEFDRLWLKGLDSFITKRISDPLMTVPILAQQFMMSESTFLRRVKRLTGYTSIQYLQEIRLNSAYQLLERNNYKSITQIATSVGYTDANYFSRLFKKRFGVSPSNFIRK
jgi:AraC-like DNA-binding protein